MNFLISKIKKLSENKNNLFWLTKRFKGKIKVSQKIYILMKKLHIKALKFSYPIPKNPIIKKRK